MKRFLLSLCVCLFLFTSSCFAAGEYSTDDGFYPLSVFNSEESWQALCLQFGMPYETVETIANQTSGLPTYADYLLKSVSFGLSNYGVFKDNEWFQTALSWVLEREGIDSTIYVSKDGQIVFSAEFYNLLKAFESEFGYNQASGAPVGFYHISEVSWNNGAGSVYSPKVVDTENIYFGFLAPGGYVVVSYDTLDNPNLHVNLGYTYRGTYSNSIQRLSYSYNNGDQYYYINWSPGPPSGYQTWPNQGAALAAFYGYTPEPGGLNGNVYFDDRPDPVLPFSSVVYHDPVIKYIDPSIAPEDIPIMQPFNPPVVLPPMRHYTYSEPAPVDPDFEPIDFSDFDTDVPTMFFDPDESYNTGFLTNCIGALPSGLFAALSLSLGVSVAVKIFSI